MIRTVGSLCSGIESGTVAWSGLEFEYKWYSEIASFPNRVLAEKYPEIKNLGDMIYIPEKILLEEIEAPDMICGGTPCQAFSFAGFQSGLNDDRGNLTSKAKRTERYTAIGNAWAVPVIRWIGGRLNNGFEESICVEEQQTFVPGEYKYYDLGCGICDFSSSLRLNCSSQPEESTFGSMKDIISAEGVEEKLYITPVACHGILRRGGIRVNPRLKEVLFNVSIRMSEKEIEEKSRRQPRGSNSGMAKLSKMRECEA